MDNARIHHGEEVLELCDRFGEHRFARNSCLLYCLYLALEVSASSSYPQTLLT